MKLVETILNRPEFQEQPPVLIDIGASYRINPKWKSIAPFCLCIAFDADQREMGYIVDESSGYRKLYIYNAIVAEQSSPEQTFYLTRSPECSSTLLPDQNSLQEWAFSPLFEVENKMSLSAMGLKTALDNLGIQQVDWFKTDSQGTDLRLFQCLGEEITQKVLVAEFEPGILDSYQGEDKLYQVMATMAGQPFWMSHLKIKGSQRIHQTDLHQHFTPFQQKYIELFLPTAPGWGEVTYFNTLSQPFFTLREFLLGWIFATIEQQHGFALKLLRLATEQWDDPILAQLQTFTLSQINRAYWKLPLFLSQKLWAKLSKAIR